MNLNQRRALEMLVVTSTQTAQRIAALESATENHAARLLAAEYLLSTEQKALYETLVTELIAIERVASALQWLSFQANRSRVVMPFAQKFGGH